MLKFQNHYNKQNMTVINIERDYIENTFELEIILLRQEKKLM